MLSSKQWNNKTSDIKLVYLYSTINYQMYSYLHGMYDLLGINDPEEGTGILPNNSNYLKKNIKWTAWHKRVYYSNTTYFGLDSNQQQAKI